MKQQYYTSPADRFFATSLNTCTQKGRVATNNLLFAAARRESAQTGGFVTDEMADY